MCVLLVPVSAMIVSPFPSQSACAHEEAHNSNTITHMVKPFDSLVLHSWQR